MNWRLLRAAGLVVVVVAAGLAWVVLGVWPPLSWSREPGPAPQIRPDWAGATLPPNIAPLNFRITSPDTGGRFVVEISSTHGDAIRIKVRDGKVTIPPRA